MTTSKEVFALRKEGALDEAYKMALELMEISDNDDWDIKAFGWCLVDLIKRDVESGHQQNLAKYAHQLEGLKIDSSDNILTKQRQYALKLCNSGGQDILKAKDLTKKVFGLRKEGLLDEAYKMALELIKNPEKDDWSIKAFSWCLVDLIKRDVNLGHQQNLSQYAKQLEDLKIDPSDNILTEQRQYALKLCTPSGQAIEKAKNLSKQGKNLEALNIYREILNCGDQSEDIQNSLAWEQYRVAKAMIGQDPPNLYEAKKYLNDYLKLKTEKPSLLHSCFLRLADDIAKKGKLNMSSFARIWKLEYLRPDDYDRYRKDEKEYSSLAEKVVQRASKDAFSRGVQEDLDYMLPFINNCVDRYPDNWWLKLSKAKVLMAIGRHGEALPLGLEVVKNKTNEYWAWSLLGDIHQPASPKSALSCYCKALLCSNDINFIYKVKIKLAELLVKNSSYPQAKLEIDEAVGYLIKNNNQVPEAIELLKGEPWYENETASPSNQELYIKNAPMAEELLYNDLPWMNGVLGEAFTTNANPNKPKRKVYIESTPMPMEASVPESKILISEKHPGMGIRIKGENDSENRFQIYKLENRDVTDKWDIFEEFIAVVDHVNQQKKLLHFMISEEINGIIKFADLSDRFDEGDAMLVRVSKYTSKQGTGYQVLTSCRTSKAIPESLVKPFEDSVREDNGMGFTDSGIFIPPQLVKAHKIEDGDYVSGQAVKNYNKKKSEWSWKAIRINKDNSTYDGRNP
jgi:hypothetical protein